MARNPIRRRLLKHRTREGRGIMYSYYMQIDIRIGYHVAYRIKKINKSLTKDSLARLSSKAILIHDHWICTLMETLESNSAKKLKLEMCIPTNQ